MIPDRFYSAIVESTWLDSLDHVNFLEYQRVADKATDELWLALGGELAASGRSTLSLVITEAHVRYLRELRLGDRVDVDSRIVAFDHRRIHLEHTLLRGAEVSCVVHVIGLAFDLGSRRAAQWPPDILHAIGRRCAQPQLVRIRGLLDDRG